MKKVTMLAGLCLVASLFVSTARAVEGTKGCSNVAGNGVWTLIPAPNDPLGRVLGPTTGDLKGAVSAYLTSLAPVPGGAFAASSVEVWALGPTDLLIFDGKAIFTPIPGKPVGTVSDALSLTVIGGTGIYTGATGSLQVTGTGHNLFGPNARPGNTYFKVRYEGNICRSY